MGGFTLHEGGKPVQVLEAKELERLSKAGEIEWPTITKEEIADRSKGDYLSKTIVLFQTTWFVGQCIARGAYGLALTELELVTVAFASLTGVIYYFWWDKPLDVHCSIPVHRLNCHEKIEGIENEEIGSRITFPPEVSNQEIREGDKVVVNPNPLPSTLIQANTSTPNPALPRTQRFQSFRRNACQKYRTFFGLGYAFIFSPLKRVFVDMVNCETLGDKTILRVPTFYSPPDENDDNCKIAIFALCVATVFGAIHCIAWSFHFATSQERWAWRISAILVSGLPSFSITSMILCLVLEKEGDETVWSRGPIYLQGVINYLYVTARITLLVLPFIALRALPPGAYVEINWVGILPHI
jgi:hypothetical protein